MQVELADPDRTCTATPFLCADRKQVKPITPVPIFAKHILDLSILLYNVIMIFTKMHGLGNDYLFIDAAADANKLRIDNPVSLARAMSNRNTGVGSDGLILIYPSERANARMEMYNADGSRAQMCGNAIRCVAKYIIEHGLANGPSVMIETDAGTKSMECSIVDGMVHSVRVDMGQPDLSPQSLPSTIDQDRIVNYPIAIGSSEYAVTCVSMGNPHAIVFVDDLEKIDLEKLGPKFENAPEFPQRINTHFVRVDAQDHVTLKSWERGSGATLACGTGACAVCVAGVITEQSQRKITVALPGGDLDIEWADNDHVYMIGPAIEVFTGMWPA